MDSSIYGDLTISSTENSIKMNYLGWATLGDYQNTNGIYGYTYLYKQGYVTEGPENTAEFYNKPFTFFNNFDQQIVTFKSYLVNRRLSYDIHRVLENSYWSPISKNPYQNITLSRSFNISYEGSPLHSSIWFKAYTDNGMSSRVTLSGMNNATDYTDRNNLTRSWSIDYNQGEGTYTVQNTNCASAQVILQDQYPTSVSMSGNTTWSTFHDGFEMALVGTNVTFSNVTESPTSQGDMDNPSPMYLVVPVGETTE